MHFSSFRNRENMRLFSLKFEKIITIIILTLMTSSSSRKTSSFSQIKLIDGGYEHLTVGISQVDKTNAENIIQSIKVISFYLLFHFFISINGGLRA